MCRRWRESGSDAARDIRRRRRWCGARTASYGNVVLSCGIGNRVVLRRLPGGAEGIQTDCHRGLTPSGRRRPVEGRLPCGFGLKRRGGDMNVDTFPGDCPAWVGSYVAEAGWARHGPNPLLLVASDGPGLRPAGWCSV